ncbi:MAG: hypothetical protein IT365_04540 [Candidatus Hydrogenedentes bacterium]|nr:hypothetical protein [Candidatus Hydrogenedentota bacterium]
MIVAEPTIGRGNVKVGPIPTFSLPSRFSCPGASPWCIKHCYAARFERVWPNCRVAYSRNLVLSWNAPRFVRAMLRCIPRDLPYLRIHVSGDFHSAQYADAWTAIARKRPNTQFFAYTRSWNVASILPALEQLRALGNVHLFASLDPDMPDPTPGWRVAFIGIDPRAAGMRCRHQQEEVESCLECGYCFRKGAGNVVFTVH